MARSAFSKQKGYWKPGGNLLQEARDLARQAGNGCDTMLRLEVEMIYFDNNATTKVLPEVKDAMVAFWNDDYGNPNSVHQEGTRIRAAVERARGKVARILGVTSSELVFTGSGSESNNHAILGALLAAPSGGNIVMSAIEHSSVKTTCEWAARRFGFELRVAPFVIRDNGVDPQPFIELIDENTRLVTCMYANNETGVVMPLGPIFEAAGKVGAVRHSDCVQGVGKLPFDPKALGIDLFGFSAHKFHGPKGSGCLYIRRGVKIESLIHGGPQENTRRAGTENVANIVGLGIALEMAVNTDKTPLQQLRDYFEANLIETLGKHARVNFQNVKRTPNCSSVCFPGQDGNVLVIKLDRKGFCASTGAACNSGSLKASGGLMAAGLSEADAAATLRFSFSKFNTREEVDQLLAILPEILKIKVATGV